MAHNTAICMWLNNNAVFLLQIENTPKFLVFFFCFFFPIAIILVSVSEERGRKEHYSLLFHRHLQTVTHYDAQEQPHWDTLHRCSSRHTLQCAAYCYYDNNYKYCLEQKSIYFKFVKESFTHIRTSEMLSVHVGGENSHHHYYILYILYLVDRMGMTE